MVLGYIVIIFVAIISFYIIISSVHPIFHIVAMWLLSITAICICKFDLMHPYFWFSCFFSLYSTAYAILTSLPYSFQYPRNYGYSYENILLPFIALFITLLVVGPKTYKLLNYKDFLKNSRWDSSNYFITRTLIIILIIATFLCVFHFMFSGYSGKVEMKKVGDLFYRSGVYFVRYLSFFCCYDICRYYSTNKNKPTKYILLSGFAVLMFSLFTGERDAILRFVANIIFALFAFRIIKRKHYFILVPLGIIAMISTVYFKYYFLTGSFNESYSLLNGNLLYKFLTTDFNSAGRNLQILLNYDWTKGYKGLSLIITDTLSAFFPSGSFFNADSWYNNTFHSGSSMGYAFTLVGMGYIMNGYLGVIVLFAILGYITKLFYKKHTNNRLWFTTYIYYISTTVFSFRQTFSTITTALVRIVGISVLLLCFLNEFANSRRYITNSNAGLERNRG